MASRAPRYFYGDFGLWNQGDVHLVSDEPLEPQVDFGADQAVALVTPLGNWKTAVQVHCVGAPHPSSKLQRGWRSQYDAIRVALRARNFRTDPLVWIDDDSTRKVVGSYNSGTATVTSNAHGRSNGDVVLIRRAGLGLWTLATVGGAATNTFVVTAVTGGQIHAIAASDDIYLVEAYWLPMISKGVAPAPPEKEGDWFARRLVYSFVGSARYCYSRTAASGVGD